MYMNVRLILMISFVTGACLAGRALGQVVAVPPVPLPARLPTTQPGPATQPSGPLGASEGAVGRLTPTDAAGKSIGQINAVAVNRDGKVLALGTADRKVRLWQVDPAKELAVLEVPAPTSRPASMPSTAQAGAPFIRKVQGVAEVCMNAKETLLAALADNRVLLWDLPHRKLMATLPAVSPRRIDLSADGKTLSVVSEEQVILTWTLTAQGMPTDASPVRRDYYRLPIQGASVFPGNTTVIGPSVEDPYGELYVASFNVGGPDKSRRALYIQVCDSRTHWLLSEFQIGSGDRDPTAEIRFSPDSRFIAAAAETANTFALFDLASMTGKNLICHTAPVTAVGFSGDGLVLASADARGTVLLWPLQRATKASNDMQALWKNVAKDSPALAIMGLWMIVEGGDKTTEFFRSRMFPTSHVDGAVFQKLIVDLDNETYTVRKDAYDKLEKMGDDLWPLLRDAKAQTRSAEVRNAVTALMGKIERPTAAQELWVLMALERIQSPRALSLLKKIAADPENSNTAKLAQAILEKPVVRQAIANMPTPSMPATAPATTQP